jgi:hypothetical protein
MREQIRRFGRFTRNILWLLALRKDSGGGTGGEKLVVSFWKFLKVGGVAMPGFLFEKRTPASSRGAGVNLA